MRSYCISILLFLLAGSPCARAQLCTNPGQTPVTAVLVCGTESFRASTLQFCGTTTIPTPCAATGFVYSNKNPNFFRMNCFSSGTLGFTLVPDDATADLSWQLFDITNTNPNDIFSNAALFVACNWSSEPGTTGATVDGNSLTVCGGGGEPVFSSMPSIITGHTYLLMVTNQSNTTSPYDLTFTGGTASITDPVEPHLDTIRARCDGQSIVLRTNKKLLCSSIAPDGSDFQISGGVVITGAQPSDCSNPLGTDSILIYLSQPIPLGNYTLTQRTGIDGNTLTDLCARSIPVGEVIDFVVTPPGPTGMTDIYVPPGCSPAFVELSFSRPVRCNSIASDASDFLFTGPQPVSAGIVQGPCASGATTSRIRLLFSPAITTGGTYQVSLRTGTDGNSLIDECGALVTPGTVFSFPVTSPLSAAFTVVQPANCRRDSIRFRHDGNNLTQSWFWEFGDGQTSTEQNPVHWYASTGTATVRLTVRNDRCTDTSRQTLPIPEDFQISFESPGEVCSGDSLPIRNTSTGRADNWRWSFGDGRQATDRDPPAPVYFLSSGTRWVTITLQATGNNGTCEGMARKTIEVVASCLIRVPTAFSPNSDGRNDFLYPVNAVRAAELEFRVFDRFGQLLFVTRDRRNRWDGRFRGLDMPAGVYVWLLRYRENNQATWTEQKGTSLLIR